MSDTVKRLTYGGREIVLVGTAHVSQESVQEVRDIVAQEKPSRVCVEIDAGRYRTLSEKSSWESLDIVKVIKEGKAFLLLANLILSSFQKRMGSETGAKPGSEMLAAVEAAKETGAEYVFCDREIQTTLRRAWGKSGFWNKMKLLASLIESAFSNEKLTEAQIEEMKAKSAIDDMMGDLADYLPQVKEVLIDERDRYLAAKIWTAGEGKSVAVVGAGHMGGIESWLEAFSAGRESTDVSELDAIPPKSHWGAVIGWSIPVLLVALAALAGFRHGWEQSGISILYWLGLNAGLAGLGAALSLAHPLTILVTILAAPIGTLSPVLAVGMFSAVAEATVRKPRVEDFEALSDDASSFRGFWRNRVTRILLVFFLSTLGGAIGNYIGLGVFIHGAI